MIRPLLLSATLVFAAGGLSGCLVGTVADAAVSVAATTVKTGAKVTGAVVGGTADALHTSDQEECVREMKRRRQTPVATRGAEAGALTATAAALLLVGRLTVPAPPGTRLSRSANHRQSRSRAGSPAPGSRW